MAIYLVRNGLAEGWMVFRSKAVKSKLQIGLVNGLLTFRIGLKEFISRIGLAES